MKANRNTLQVAMARRCMTLKTLADAAQMPESTVKNVLYGRNVMTNTLGRVCKALGVDPADVVEFKEDQEK